MMLCFVQFIESSLNPSAAGGFFHLKKLSASEVTIPLVFEVMLKVSHSTAKKNGSMKSAVSKALRKKTANVTTDPRFRDNYPCPWYEL